MSLGLPQRTRTQHAVDVPFDNSTNGFISTDTQHAIEEIRALISSTASPGFTYGRSGAIPSNSYLLNESVPSNVAGRVIYLSSAKIVKIATGTETVDTYNLQIYSHDGNEVNLTLLTTVSIVATRYYIADLNISVAQNKQIAIKLSSGSAKNIVTSLQITGTYP